MHAILLTFGLMFLITFQFIVGNPIQSIADNLNILRILIKQIPILEEGQKGKLLL